MRGEKPVGAAPDVALGERAKACQNKGGKSALAASEEALEQQQLKHSSGGNIGPAAGFLSGGGRAGCGGKEVGGQNWP
jgi:hypothetical protein